MNMQPAGQKCQLKHGRETNGISHVYQTCQADAKKGHLKAKKGHLKAKNASKNMTWRRKLPIEQSIYLSTYLSIRPSIHAFIHLCLYLSIHLRYLCLSPYLPISLSIDLSICQTCQADVNMQPAGQKCQLKHGRETNGVSHVYQTCQADAKKGHLKAKNASKNMTGRRKLSM